MEPPENFTTQDLHAALFANLVMQQGNMALMFLGRIPNPQTSETIRELEAARMFIDQLEMLEVKTKGNLSPEESALLNQTLMSVRMAFVEESGLGAEPKQSAPEPAPESRAEQPEDDKKKFVKKY